jgi:hypothetical protein
MTLIKDHFTIEGWRTIIETETGKVALDGDEIEEVYQWILKERNEDGG